MVPSTFIVFLLWVAASWCRGDSVGKDFVYWKKADIKSYDTYFPSRALKEEQLTNSVAKAAVNAVEYGLLDSLNKMVWYPNQELETAKLIMEGTSAQGCVNGISTYMSNGIKQEISNYIDCSADATPKLIRLYNIWNTTYSQYQTEYAKALQGIDNCAKTYPNKDSSSRLIMCVESWSKNYFSAANSISSNVYNSPSMRVFMNTVLPCAQTAAQGVTDRGWKFLSMLVQCAKLSKNIDFQDYEEQAFRGYSNYITDINVDKQIKVTQDAYKGQVDMVEQELINYYNLQKSKLEKYVIKPRSQSYYDSQMRGYLQKYYSAVSSTAADNPANMGCALAATNSLNHVVIEGSVAALEYDQYVVNQTKEIFLIVEKILFELNEKLPLVGNAAILYCFTEGYVFADNTILKCSSLKSMGFNVCVAERNEIIENHVNKLLEYENSFFGSSSLPGGEKVLSKAFLKADQALYGLQRCLYINSGTKYAVTTPTSSFDVTTISTSNS